MTCFTSIENSESVSPTIKGDLICDQKNLLQLQTVILIDLNFLHQSQGFCVG